MRNHIFIFSLLTIAFGCNGGSSGGLIQPGTLVASFNVTVANGPLKDKSLFVFHGDSSKNLIGKLQELAETHTLKIPLTVTVGKDALKSYRIPEEAGVYAVLYEKRKVVRSMFFKDPDFNKEAVDAVLAEIKKLAGV